MSSRDVSGSDPGGRPAGSGPLVAQILVDLKNPDPTGRTAGEAIRTLLGYGDRLVELRRREFYEMLCRPDGATDPAATPLGPVLLRYLETTTVMWNSNKQRAWLRVSGSGEAGGAWEAFHGRPAREGSFGAPGLDDAEFDHIMVWRRDHRSAPEDLARALAGWSLVAEGSCELYSLRWASTASPEERRAWTDAVSTVRSRGSGLLVNPHYQDHRLLFGAVPVPFWGNA